ncbi:MAG TPA: hypothetical protein VGG75_05370 [Trebonia sp.]
MLRRSQAGRHPELKVVSIENGSSWLKPLFKTVDKEAALGRRGAMIGGQLPDRPGEALARRPDGTRPVRPPRSAFGQSPEISFTCHFVVV